MEDVAGQISDVGRTDLYEAGVIMRDFWFYIQTVMYDMWQEYSPFIYAVLIVTGMVLILGMAI